MIYSVLGLVIGLAVLIVGVFYLVKEKHDKESVKIYGIISAAGGVIFAAALLRMLFTVFS